MILVGHLVVKRLLKVKESGRLCATGTKSGRLELRRRIHNVAVLTDSEISDGGMVKVQMTGGEDRG